MAFSSLVIIDFDGVLFNDQRFKADYESLFRRAGVSHEVYERTYEQTKKKGYYDPRIHIQLALAHKSSVQTRLYAHVRRFVGQSSDYIYKDVPDFLMFLEKEGISAVVLSTGDAQFQKQKIQKSGITDCFEEIIIVPNVSKVVALHTLIRKKKPASAIFIDDKKEVVEEVKKSLPEVYTIQMRRRETQAPARGGDLEIKDFSESVEFISAWHRENRG